MPSSKKNKGTWLVIDHRRVGTALVAPLAAAAGYDLAFAHFDEEVARYYAKENKYRVHLSYPDARAEETVVDHFTSFFLEDATQFQACITASATKVVSISIHPVDYKKVAPLLAEACALRALTQPKLTLVLTEKTTKSRERFLRALTKAGAKKILDRAVLVEALSDCIVPQYPPFSPIIFREAYGELWIENGVPHKALTILPHTTTTPYLDAYREQKLFGLNGLQVSAAVIGDAVNVYTIDVALRHPFLAKFFMRMHRDRAAAMAILIPHFSEKEHAAYLTQVTARLQNVHFTDTIDRLLGNLAAKLDAKERLVRIALAMPQSIYLSSIIALGIAYLRRTNRRYAQQPFSKVLDTVVHLPTTPKAKELRRIVIAAGDEIERTSSLQFIHRIAKES